MASAFLTFLQFPFLPFPLLFFPPRSSTRLLFFILFFISLSSLLFSFLIPLFSLLYFFLFLLFPLFPLLPSLFPPIPSLISSFTSCSFSRPLLFPLPPFFHLCQLRSGGEGASLKSPRSRALIMAFLWDAEESDGWTLASFPTSYAYTFLTRLLPPSFLFYLLFFFYLSPLLPTPPPVYVALTPYFSFISLLFISSNSFAFFSTTNVLF